MGKVTGMLYASIFLVLGGVVLAAAMESTTLMWTFWGLAALMLVVLCVFGYRLDSLVSSQNVRELGAVSPTHTWPPQRRDKGKSKSSRDAAWHDALKMEADARQNRKLRKKPGIHNPSGATRRIRTAAPLQRERSLRQL